MRFKGGSTNLAKINTALVVLIILVNGYVIGAPFAPNLLFWWQNRGNSGLQTQLTQQTQPSRITRNIPQDNRLVVPAMGLDQPIIEGKYESALMHGPWRRPHSSTPDAGGNTVIAGHRFTYTNPHGSFYFLNKVSAGDTFVVYWNHKAYAYKVTEVKVVPPSETNIEENTAKPQVTLFTCTPLWWPKDRLVVIGSLERTYE